MTTFADLECAASEAAAAVYGCAPDRIDVSIAPEEPRTIVVNWPDSMIAGAAAREAAKQAVLAVLPDAYRGYKVMTP